MLSAAGSDRDAPSAAVGADDAAQEEVATDAAELLEDGGRAHGAVTMSAASSASPSPPISAAVGRPFASQPRAT